MTDKERRYRTLSLERRGHVAVLAIPDFAGDDSVFAALSRELTAVCSEIAFAEDIRALVMTVSEEANASPQNEDPIPSVPDASSTSLDAPARIGALGFPTIAAIGRDAIGFGLELAMACDIRIAAETSRFGLPQVRDGIIPSHGGTQRLPRLVGTAKAMELILTGDLIDAEEAYRLSLVNRIVPARDVEAAALDIAQNMATKGPVSLRFAKEAIHKGTDLTLEQGLRLEMDLYLLLHSTADRVEGIEAFRQKRKPEFRGE